MNTGFAESVGYILETDNGAMHKADSRTESVRTEYSKICDDVYAMKGAKTAPAAGVTRAAIPGGPT